MRVTAAETKSLRLGKELLERRMLKKRPDYQDYVRRTSGFFPLPPRD